MGRRDRRGNADRQGRPARPSPPEGGGIMNMKMKRGRSLVQGSPHPPGGKAVRNPLPIPCGKAAGSVGTFNLRHAARLALALFAIFAFMPQPARAASEVAGSSPFLSEFSIFVLAIFVG